MGLILKGIDVPYLVEDFDRHGNQRLYAQRPRCTKVRIREKLGTPEFFAAYTVALALSVPREVKQTEAGPGTLRWLCQQYFARALSYKKLEPSTRSARRGILEKLCEAKDSKGRKHGDKMAAGAKPHHLEEIRDTNADRPEAANGIIKALRQLYKWAKSKPELDGHRLEITTNPADDVAYLPPNNPEGFHTWTVAEVEQFETKHPIGSKARLAMALLLYSGVRRSDVVRLGPQMVRGGMLHFIEFKGRKKERKERQMPVLPVLADVISKTTCGHLAYLVTEFNRPFSRAGFGNRFRKWCDDAQLHHCSAHGLRKAAATLAAENGATTHQLMAMFGWRSIKQAEIYTRKAREKKLTASGMHLISLRSEESPTSADTESPTKLSG